MVSFAVFIWTITFLSTVGWQFWQKHGVSHNQNGRDFFAKTRTRVINAILVWWHFCAIWQWSPLLPALLILTYTLHGPCVLLPCILLATGENLYFRYLKHLVHLFFQGKGFDSFSSIVVGIPSLTGVAPGVSLLRGVSWRRPKFCRNSRLFKKVFPSFKEPSI